MIIPERGSFVPKGMMVLLPVTSDTSFHPEMLTAAGALLETESLRYSSFAVVFFAPLVLREKETSPRYIDLSRERISSSASACFFLVLVSVVLVGTLGVLTLGRVVGALKFKSAAFPVASPVLIGFGEVIKNPPEDIGFAGPPVATQ